MKSFKFPAKKAGKPPKPSKKPPNGPPNQKPVMEADDPATMKLRQEIDQLGSLSSEDFDKKFEKMLVSHICSYLSYSSLSTEYRCTIFNKKLTLYLSSASVSYHIVYSVYMHTVQSDLFFKLITVYIKVVVGRNNHNRSHCVNYKHLFFNSTCHKCR